MTRLHLALPLAVGLGLGCEYPQEPGFFTPMPSPEVPATDPITPRGRIVSLPVSIDAAGSYTLAQDFALVGIAGGGAAITITASNVDLDLDGHSIVTGDAGPWTAGIRVEHASRVSIHDGRLAGFFFGVEVADDVGADGRPAPTGVGHVLGGLEIDSSRYKAIEFSGNHSTISGNVVTRTGGWLNDTTTYIHAMSVFGDSVTISGNVVSGSTNLGAGTAKETVGIACGNCPLALIEENEITDDPDHCVFSYGVWVSGDLDAHRELWARLRRNSFRGLVFGIGYGHMSSGTIDENEFTDILVPLYDAPSHEFGEAGTSREIVSPFPDATWIDLGGNRVLPGKRRWSDFEAGCPSLFE